MLLSEKEKDRKIAIFIGNLKYKKREIFFLVQDLMQIHKYKIHFNI